MKTIFISRNLTSTSVFKKELEAAGFTIHGLSLLKFSAITISRIPKSDWIFFYSKNGVKFFFQGLKKAGKKIPKVKWGAIGKGTGKILQTKIEKVDFTGDGNTLRTASDFLKIAQGKTVLFPQAQHSRKTIQKLLNTHIVSKELVVYKNEVKKQFSIPDCEILVFTSPMNAKAYFEKKKLFNDQKVFALGRTTAKTLVGLGIEDFNVAEEPSEKALVKGILELIKA